MTSGVGNRIFIDANILVYVTVASAPFHREAARALRQLYVAGMQLWVSRQIIRECLATLSRPQTFMKPLPASSLIALVEVFTRQFQIAEDGPLVMENLGSNSLM